MNLLALEISSFLIAILAGILIGIPTGPARFFVVDTYLNEGKSPALRLYAGFFLAIIIYAGLALVANNLISQNPRVEAISHLIASALLIFWGILIIATSGKENQGAMQLNFKSWTLKGFVAGISNPVIPFIYLTLIQFVKSGNAETSIGGNAIFILLFEVSSFLTTFAVAVTVFRKRSKILGNWKVVKILMGTLLIGIGIYNTYQQLDFSNGIRIKDSKNAMEKVVD